MPTQKEIVQRAAARRAQEREAHTDKQRKILGAWHEQRAALAQAHRDLAGEAMRWALSCERVEGNLTVSELRTLIRRLRVDLYPLVAKEYTRRQKRERFNRPNGQ